MSNKSNKEEKKKFYQFLEIENPKEGLQNELTTIQEEGTFREISKEKIKNNQEAFFNLDTIVVLALILITDLYYLSIDMLCPYDTEKKCFFNFIYDHILRIVRDISIIVILLDLSLLLIIFKKTIPTKRFLIIFTFNFLLLFNNWEISYFDYHKFFHICTILGFLSTITLFNLLYLIYKIIVTKSNRVRVIGLIILVSLGLFVSFRIVFSCQNWAYGVDGKTRIDQSGPYCKIPEPNYCAYVYFGGVVNYQVFQEECSKNYGTFDKIKANLPTDKQYIAYPPSNQYEGRFRMYRTISDLIVEDAISVHSMDDPQAKNSEVFLDISDTDKIEMIINVKRNEELIKERKEKAQEYTKQNEGILPNSYLFIFVDALSRAQIQRSMPKLSEWLKQNMNTNIGDEDEKEDQTLDFTEYFRYHSIAPFTFPNMDRIYFGRSSDEVNLTSKTTYSYVKTFKENGFITGYATDEPEVNNVYQASSSEKISAFIDEPWDHEGASVAMDPNYQDPKWLYPYVTGPYSMAKRCLYGKHVCEQAIEYGRQFWNQYNDTNKLLYMNFIDGHEGSLLVLQYLDIYLTDFLQELKDQNQLDDTMIVLFADHGQHMSGHFDKINSSDFILERVLPALFIGTPKNMDLDLKQNIKENSQSLVSPMDIHNLFMGVAQGIDSKYIDQSILSNKFPKDRTCNDLNLFVVNELYCQCT